MADNNEQNTTVYNVDEFEDELVRTTLDEVYQALVERGYNPINQLIGYIMSGDPGYISSFKDARNKIQSVERAKIVEILLSEFQKKKK